MEVDGGAEDAHATAELTPEGVAQLRHGHGERTWEVLTGRGRWRRHARRPERTPRVARRPAGPRQRGAGRRRRGADFWRRRVSIGVTPEPSLATERRAGESSELLESRACWCVMKAIAARAAEMAGVARPPDACSARKGVAAWRRCRGSGHPSSWVSSPTDRAADESPVGSCDARELATARCARLDPYASFGRPGGAVARA